MIVCPNCNHQNPEGASQCEACYTPLPLTTHCPNCDAVIQTDASFCGQCGYSISPVIPPTVVPEPIPDEVSPPPPTSGKLNPDLSKPPEPVTSPPPVPENPPPVAPNPTVTKIQQQSARLLHLSTNTLIELPPHLTVVHLGKPNDIVPPDIDVSGFPHSEVVSRIHADIRFDGDTLYIEDVGSSNGTYINNIPLPKGNRHRLRAGDRISLGKGDLVSFVFQWS